MAEPQLLPILTVTAAAGVLFHISTIHIELDFIILHLFSVLLFLTTVGTLYLHDTFHLPLHLSLLPPVLSAITFTIATLVSTALHRLCFHRLRRFPGPTLAKLTKLYSIYHVSQKPQLHHLTARLHATYGPIVRTGPRELSITLPSATASIYSSSSRCTKSTFYGQSMTEEEANLFLLRERSNHAVRRKAWDRGLNGPALQGHQQKIEKLAEKMVEKIPVGETVDAAEWGRFFGFDSMGVVGFGRSYGMLDSGKRHDAVTALIDGGWYFGVLGHLPWLVRILFRLGAGGALARFRDWCISEMRGKIAELQKGEEEEGGSLVEVLLRDEKCGLGKISETATMDDSRLVVIAGADTTASVIASMLHFLAKNPDKQRKLWEELRSEITEKDGFDYAKVQKVPYVDAFINETLRLLPPVLSGPPRETPKEGLVIDGVFIPGGVVVSTPTWLMHRDQRFWGETATDFVPERWLVGNVPDKNIFSPFSIGVYQCAGKALAMMELRMVLAKMVLGFEVGFPEGNDGEAGRNMQEEVWDLFTMKVPRCPIVLRGR